MSVCLHLMGTWRRRGKFSILTCENGDYQMIIDVDSPEAFALFEGNSGCIQRFGKDLQCATPDDEERLQGFLDRGLEL